MAVLAGIIVVAGSSTLAGAQADGDQSAIVRMRGTTGQEQARVVYDGDVLATLSPTASWNDYSFTVPAGAETFRVEFLNDGSTESGSDKNLLVDWIRVGENLIQAESETVQSKGVWNGSDCGQGYRKSEFLACNGWFEFDLSDGGTETTTPPPAGPIEFALYGRGSTGSEFVELQVNGTTMVTMQLGKTDGWQSIPLDADDFINGDPRHPDNVIRLLFVNDGRDSTGADRNVRIGSFELDGAVYNPLDLKSKGSWNGTDCGEGFRNSNWIHCNGWFELAGATTPPPPEETVLVAALLRGTTGTEQIGVEINGRLASTHTLSTTNEWYESNFDVDDFVNSDPGNSSNVIRVLFMNDGYDPIGGDRNIHASAFEYNGTVLKPQDLKSKGSWNGTDCGEGFRNSNWIHCTGWFELVAGDDGGGGEANDWIVPGKMGIRERGQHGTAVMSRDGEAVAYYSGLDPENRSVVIKMMDDGVESVAASGLTLPYVVAVADGGDAVLYWVGGDLIRQEADGSNREVVFAGSAGISYDRWLEQIVVRPRRAADRFLWSPGGATTSLESDLPNFYRSGPRIAANGEYLFWTDSDEVQWTLHRVPIAGGPEVTIAPDAEGVMRFSVDGSKVLFETPNGPRTGLILTLLDVQSGDQQVFEVPFDTDRNLNYQVHWASQVGAVTIASNQLQGRLSLISGSYEESQLPDNTYLLDVSENASRELWGTDISDEQYQLRVNSLG